MTYEVMGPRALDYLPCRYGASKMLFRGPKRDLDKPYVAFVGGTETYGKFIEKPFPALVEQETGATCANFGYVNAGLDAFMHDPFVPAAAGKADVTVLQVMGAHNMTNRFYSVHPRRNDRFVSASTLLRTIYREVDFAEYNFNRHMLGDLLAICPDRFEAVRSELQHAWCARMRSLLGRVSGKTVLLWFASTSPDDAQPTDRLGADPLFVTREMIDSIAPLVTEVVEVTASPEARAAGTHGMAFSEMEAPVASEMMGPKAHEEAARAVSRVIRKLR